MKKRPERLAPRAFGRLRLRPDLLVGDHQLRAVGGRGVLARVEADVVVAGVVVVVRA